LPLLGLLSPGELTMTPDNTYKFNINPYFIGTQSNLTKFGDQFGSGSPQGKSREDLIGYAYNLLTNQANRRER
jgi:hypothetical protein